MFKGRVVSLSVNERKKNILVGVLIVHAMEEVRNTPFTERVGVTHVTVIKLFQIKIRAVGSQVLNALWANTPGTTGIENLDNLLARGGVLSMAWTLILAIMALALGGLMHGAGFLRVLLSGIIARVQRVASLIATTLVSGLIGNMAMGEAYISIILNCQLFQLKYQEQGLDPAVLSRTVEEGSTLTTGLIPWTTAGAFYSATLGISALDYAPYAFFNYLNAMVAVTMASAGLGLLRSSSTVLTDQD